MAKVEGIAIKGEYVESVEDKTFQVTTNPEYVELQDPSDPEKKVRRLLIGVTIASGETLDYYPNKSSVKQMATLYGFEMEDWVGKKFEWEVSKQQAFGKEQKVLFVTDKKIKV